MPSMYTTARLGGTKVASVSTVPYAARNAGSTKPAHVLKTQNRIVVGRTGGGQRRGERDIQRYVSLTEEDLALTVGLTELDHQRDREDCAYQSIMCSTKPVMFRTRSIMLRMVQDPTQCDLNAKVQSCVSHLLQLRLRR